MKMDTIYTCTDTTIITIYCQRCTIGAKDILINFKLISGYPLLWNLLLYILQYPLMV
jgi:hypothetical protein